MQALFALIEALQGGQLVRRCTMRRSSHAVHTSRLGHARFQVHRLMHSANGLGDNCADLFAKQMKQTEAPSYAALVLHGKLGSFDRGVAPSRSVQAGVRGALDLAVLCYAAFVQHVIEPSRHEGLDMHIFAHSWNPELGDALDALYQTRLSLHELEAVERNRRLCGTVDSRLRWHPTVKGFRGFFMDGGWAQDSCERTASHLLGIARAVNLMRRAERRDGLTYGRALLARWDLLFQRPLALTSLPIARGAFVLPHMCAPAPALDHRVTSDPGGRTLAAHRARVCQGHGHDGASVALSTTAAVECSAASRGCSTDLTLAARGVFLLDWWLAAPSADLVSFAALGEAASFANLTVYAAEALHVHAVQRQVAMGHLYWGTQIIQRLRGSLRWSRHLGVDFVLGRMWHTGRCLALRTRCGGGGSGDGGGGDDGGGGSGGGNGDDGDGDDDDGGSGSGTGGGSSRGGGGAGASAAAVDALTPRSQPRVCGVRDVVRRPWQGHVPVRALWSALPSRPSATVSPAGVALRAACDDGYFYCEAGSRMCREEEAVIAVGLNPDGTRLVSHCALSVPDLRFRYR